MQRILNGEGHDANSEYMFIGITVLLIVFIGVGVFLESRHVSELLGIELTFLDQNFTRIDSYFDHIHSIHLDI
jgi:hypothetical protein